MRLGLHNESRFVTNVESVAGALMSLKSQKIIKDEEIMITLELGLYINQQYLLEASWKDEFQGSDDMCEENEKK